MSFARTPASWLVLMLVAACGGEPTESTIEGPPGLHILSGATITDTITAALPDSLVVELRDSAGRLLPNQAVDFKTESLPEYGQALMLIVVPGPTYFTTRITTYTDSLGHAAARLRMGRVAGTARVFVSAPQFGFADTAHFTILPGAPAKVTVQPRDSAVFIDQTLRLGSTAVDRGGNPATVEATYAVLAGPVTVESGAGLVTPAAYGTARIVAHAGSGADTARLAIVPRGAVVLSSDYAGLVVMNLDGTGRRSLGTYGSDPTWSPDGEWVLYAASGLRKRLVQSGYTAAVMPSDTLGGSQTMPLYSHDGSWIYFQRSAAGQGIALYRVRPSGTGLERVSPPGNLVGEGHPSTSPDDRRLTFFESAGVPYIRVRDLTTNQLSGRLAVGITPTWSPVDDLVAFNEYDSLLLSRGLLLMRADGSGLRRLAPVGLYFPMGVNWSPDGKWIVAGGKGLRLIEVATNLMIELPFVENVNTAAWKPDGLLH